MRLMSFALTTDQIRRRTKTVTRRLGWRFLSRSMASCGGETVQPIEKGQGLKKGETVRRLNGPIRIVSMRIEPLRRMTDDPEYGTAECVKEGFPNLTPAEFVAMFCKHNRVTPDTEITRIEFEYVRSQVGPESDETTPLGDLQRLPRAEGDGHVRSAQLDGDRR